MMATLAIAGAVLAACMGLRRVLGRPGRRERTYFGGRVRLTVFWNRGAAFGLPIPQKALAALSVPLLAALWLLRRRSPLGAGLALGGGASNLWERIRHGKVLDYAAFPRGPKRLRHLVYNLADFAIFLGAVLLALGRERK